VVAKKGGRKKGKKKEFPKDLRRLTAHIRWVRGKGGTESLLLGNVSATSRRGGEGKVASNPQHPHPQKKKEEGKKSPYINSRNTRKIEWIGLPSRRAMIRSGKGGRPITRFASASS